MEYVHLPTGIAVDLPMPAIDRGEPIEACFGSYGPPLEAVRLSCGDVQLPEEILLWGIAHPHPTRGAYFQLVPMIGPPRSWARYTSEQRPGESRWQQADGAPESKRWVDCEWTRQRDDEGRAPTIKSIEFAVNHNGSPVSHSLPRKKIRNIDGSFVGKEATLGEHKVIEHPDGTVTDTHGRPLVRNREDHERQCARTGMVRHDGDPRDD